MKINAAIALLVMSNVAPHVALAQQAKQVEISVDARRETGNLPPVWRFFWC